MEGGPEWEPMGQTVSPVYASLTAHSLLGGRRRPPRGARSTHSSISKPSTRHVSTRQSLCDRQVASPRSTLGLLYDERMHSCRSTSQSFSAIHHISNPQFWKLSYLSICLFCLSVAYYSLFEALLDFCARILVNRGRRV